MRYRLALLVAYQCFAFGRPLPDNGGRQDPSEMMSYRIIKEQGRRQSQPAAVGIITRYMYRCLERDGKKLSRGRRGRGDAGFEVLPRVRRW